LTLSPTVEKFKHLATPSRQDVADGCHTDQVPSMRSLSLRASALRYAVGLIVLTTVGTSVQAQSTFTWNTNAAATWDTATSNWLLNGSAVPYVSASQNIAQFGDIITAGRAIGVVSGGVTAGQIQFINGGTFAYTLGSTGNAITLNNGASNAVVSVGPGFVGTSTYSGTGGNTISSSTLFYTNGLNLVNNGAFGTTNLTIGAIDRTTAGGGIFVGGQGNTSLNGVISANTTGGITKTGTGTLNLTGVNLFTGTVAVNGGVLAVTADTGFGAAANPVNINGGTVRFAAATTPVSRVFTIGASGGGIDLFSGTSSTLGASGQLTGSGPLLISTSGSSTVSATTLNINAANSGYTGAITVGAPALQLVGSTAAIRVASATNNTILQLGNTGTLNSSSVTVNNGAALTITQPTTAVTGRLPSSTPLVFHSGRFAYNTNTNGNSAIVESFGNVTATGQFLITGSSAAGPTAGTTLNFGTLTRNDNAVLVFRAPVTGTGSIGGAPGTGTRMFFSGLVPDTTSSGTTRSVIPWAGNTITTASSFIQNFMTYDSNGFRPLNQTTEVVALSTVNALATAASNVNIRVTGGATQTINVGGQTINSYQQALTHTLSGTATQTVPGDVLTITSGGWANNNSQTISNATINFPNGGYFLQGDNVTVSGFSRITGSGGLTVTSFNTSYSTSFSNTPDGGNSFTGGLFIQGVGRVNYTLNNQLGNTTGGLAAGDITLGGGQLLYGGTGGATLSDGSSNRNIRVNESNGTIGVNSSGSGTLLIPGVISGPGQVQFGGGLSTNTSAIVELTNPSANTYTGGTLVSTGILRISNTNQLGTGPIILNGGTLQSALGSTQTYTSPITLTTSSTLALQDATVTLAGGLNGSGGTAGSSATTLALTRNGSLSAASTLNITGPGNYAGTLAINQGAVVLSGNGALPNLGAITLTANAATVPEAGSQLSINDSFAPLLRTGRSTNLSLVGTNVAGTTNPVVNLTTNSAGSLFRFGTLAVTGGGTTFANTSTLNIIDGNSGNNTIRFTSLTTLLANNFLNIVGTANLGLGSGGGTRIFFDTAPSLTNNAIPNVTFTGSDQSGGLLTGVPATYDPVLGLIALLNATGTVIDNFNAPITSKSFSFTTTGPTQANLGASIKNLTLAGHVLTLVDAGYTPGAANDSAPSNTLIINAGSLTSNTGASSITSTIPTTVRFGVSGPTPAIITATTDLTIDANVTLVASGGLTKTGAGVLTINGTNTITGNYSLAGGLTTLPATTAASLTGSGPLAITGALTFGPGSATAIYSGLLSGTGGVATSAGFTGSQTLSGANTFSGAVNIAGGTLVVGNATALGASTNAVTVASGATLGFSGTITVSNTNPLTISGSGAAGRIGAIDNISGTNSFAGPITLAANAVIGSTAGTLTLSGGITGTGVPTFTGAGNVTLTLAELNIGTNTLFKTGTGTLTLPDFANTIGGINVSGGGTVAFFNSNNLGSGTVTVDNGGITYSGTTPATIPSNLVINSGGVIFGVTNAAAVLSFSGPYTPSAPTTKIGAGTLRLAAATPLTTTQTLNINAGTFDVNGNNVTVGGLGGTGGTLAIGTTTFTLGSPNTNSTLASAVTGTGTFVISSGALTLTGASFAPRISGPGGIAFSPATAGSLLLSNSANDYSGGTTFGNFGRASVGASNAFGTGPLTFTHTASTSFGTPTIGMSMGANGTATLPNDIFLSTTPSITSFISQLEGSGIGQTLTLSGKISGGNAAGTILEIETSGTNTTAVTRFTNPLNDFLADTIRISYGTLAISSNAALGAPTNRLSISSTTGFLRLEAPGINLARPIIAPGQIVTQGNNFTVSGLISGTTAFTVSGGGVMTATAANTNSSTITITPGTTSGGGLTLSGAGTFLSATTLTAGNGGLQTAITFDNRGPAANAIGVRYRATSNVTLNNASFTVLGNDDTTPASVSNATGNLGTLTITGSNNIITTTSFGAPVDLYFSSLAPITAGNSVVFSGTNLGDFATSGSVSHIYFTTAPTLTNGVIANAFYGSLGTPATYDVTRGVIEFIPPSVAGTVLDNIGTDLTAPVVVTTVTSTNTFLTTGSALAKLGATVGGLTLDAGTTFTLRPGVYTPEAANGNAAIDSLVINGTLRSTAGNFTILGEAASQLVMGTSSSINVGTGTTLTIAGTNVALAGTLGLNKVGAGTLLLDGGTHTITGGIAVNAGTLRLATAATLPAANSLTVAAGGTLDMNSIASTFASLAGGGSVLLGSSSAAILTINGTTSTTFSGAISGSGGLTYAGTGTLTLSGTNTFSGGLLVTSGTVGFASAAGLGGGTVTVNGGGLSYTGAASGAFPAVTIGGNGASLGVSTAGVVATLGAGITTTATITKTGAGTLRLAPASANSFGPLAISAGTFDVNGNNTTVGSLSGTGLTATVALGSTTFTVNQDINTTYAGTISGSNGTFIKAGTGTLSLSATAIGSIAPTNVQVTGGTLRLSGTTPLTFAIGTNFTVSSGATLDFGAFGAGSTTNTFGDIAVNGGTVLIQGIDDPFIKSLTFAGGTLDFTGSSNMWLHFNGTGAGINVNTAGTTVNFIQGSSTTSRIMNDTAAPLPIVVASNSPANGIDLDAGILMSSIGTNNTFDKRGPGTMQLSFPGTNTASFIVSGGRLLVKSGTSVSGNVAVNAGGTLGGTGTITGSVTVNAGGTLEGTGTITGATTVNAGGSINPGTPGTPGLPGVLIAAATTINGGTGTSWKVKLFAVGPNSPTTAASDPNTVSILSVTGANNLNLVTTGGPIRFDLTNLAGTFTENSPVSYVIATTTTGAIRENGTDVLAGNPLLGTNYQFTGVNATDFNLRVESVNSVNSLVLSFTPVPEPAGVVVLGGLALGGLGWIRRRRAAKARA
jgi:autotransporter-associated beta strand protein